MPGNFGLKDQQLVFKWIQNHIEVFDGDKTRVTIFGQSAGGVATHLHLLNPNSAYLFHNVISMSGTANVPFAITKNPLEQARKTAELCEIENANRLSTAELANALRNVDVLRLINAGDGLKYWDVDPLTNYRPVVERETPDSIVPADPEEMMKGTKYQARPWLIGTVPEEGAVRVVNIIENSTLLNQFNARTEFLLQELMEWPDKYSRHQKEHRTAVVVTEYLRGIWNIRRSNQFGFLDAITDRGFKHPLYKAIRENYERRTKIWYHHFMYNFNYKGPFSYASLYTQANVTGKYGVVHCDDLIYLFRSPLLFPDFDKKSIEAQVIDSFVTYIVNFARFGYVTGVPTIGACSAGTLSSRPNSICDYHEFVNSDSNPNGFEVRVNSRFPTEKVRLWQELLDEKV
ncbi:juvenile hormone esterase-like isoform X3 [Drosophila tropicalis]